MKHLTTILILLLTITGIQTFAQNSNDSAKVKAMRHEFVQQGKHKNELKLGDYVIAAIFKSEENAKHITEEYHKNGFPEANYGYLSSKNTWYVHLAVFDEIDKAQEARNKHQKQKMFKDAWLLTVHQ